MSQITDYIKVSELDKTDRLSAQDLLLVATREAAGNAGVGWHRSRKVSYYDFYMGIAQDAGISSVEQDIAKLSGYVRMSCLHRDDTELQSVSCELASPYVISSATQQYGRITSLSGYRLASVIPGVLDDTPVNTIRANSIGVSSLNIGLSVRGDVVRDGPATLSNRLATENFVNSSIEHYAAFYITRDLSGNAFGTFGGLSSATAAGELYVGGDKKQPKQNDYCVVLSDETVTTRYPEIPGGASAVYTVRYQWSDTTKSPLAGKSGWWQFMYIVNNSPYTAEQWSAINSGISRDNRVYREGHSYSSDDGDNVPVYVDGDGKVQKSKDFRNYCPRSAVEEWRFYMEGSGDVVHKQVVVLSSWTQAGG